MLPRLVFLFTVVPAVELYLLISVGSKIGAMQTIMIIVLTGVIGAWLARREGWFLWMKVNQKLQQGQMPGDEMIEGLMIMIAGALLLTPGFMTDAAGFALLIPPVRMTVVKHLKQRFKDSVVVHSQQQRPGPKYYEEDPF